MKNKENFVLDLKDTLRSVLVAIISALAFVLIFALILRWASLPDTVITPVNYVIKFLSLLLGIMIGFKHRKNGILKGAIVGLTFMLLSWLIFTAMDGFKSVNFRPLDLVFHPHRHRQTSSGPRPRSSCSTCTRSPRSTRS